MIRFCKKRAAVEGFISRFLRTFFSKISSLGFTLLEIMVVIAIIVIISAMAIPAILRNRITANEAAAITSLKTVDWAAIAYRATNGAYPPDLNSLGTCDPSYIDSVLASGTKQGYKFNLTSNNDTFSIAAVPATQNVTGVRTFYSDTSGVIRVSSSGVADASSPSI